MKKMLAILLLLWLVLPFFACGAKETGITAPDDGETPDVAPTEGGTFTEEDWNKLQDWAHAQGWDGEGYHFPEVESMREWPPSSFWAAVGLPELTPDNMENGEIYNDGNTHVDGYSDTFVAKCDTEEASFQALAQKLWDAGYKHIDVGGGNLMPAEDIEWLLSEDGNYLWFRAYYVYEGDIMEVYLQYTNGWDTILWVGVTYAPSDPDFEQWPKVNWPGAEIKGITGVDLPNPGGTAYGSVNAEADYPEIRLVITGLSQAEYEAYLEKLRGGSVPVIEDDNGGYGFHDTYGYAFYPSNYEEYPSYIDINYYGGYLTVYVFPL